MADLVWERPGQRMVLSPGQGGRVLSWVQDEQERVMAPVLLEGGLARVLFAEEQYPGSSYTVPHTVVSHAADERGFRTHLRHFWNAGGACMRACGWPEKANELHLDGLRLDKIVQFDAGRACLLLDVTFTNRSNHTKHLTPWLHNSLSPWPAQCFVVADGQRVEYHSTDIYWGDHVVERQGQTMRLVHADAAGEYCSVLGAATEHLRGMSALLPVPGEFYQSPTELRYLTIALPAGHAFHANAFLALTRDWRTWAEASPLPLFSRVEPAEASALEGPEIDLATLAEWALPRERERGLMVLSFLDKPPFSSAERFAAAEVLAGFHRDGDAAAAHVVLCPLRDLEGVTAELSAAGPGGSRWELTGPEGQKGRRLTMRLSAHRPGRLVLRGPADLQGRDALRVRLFVPGTAGGPLDLTVPADAGVERSYPYQVRQSPTYFRLRHNDRLGPPDGCTAEEFRQWQERMGERMRRWLAFHALGPCELEPRLVERQEGPTCIREKWLVQTEPGVWVPGFLVRPRGVSGRLPLLYFLHGSGPGKDNFAPDEIAHPVRTQMGHELEYMPYALAAKMPCLVWVPDGRGQGEMGETNPASWPARNAAMGVDNVALRLWDQIRCLDWMEQRDDVDPRRLGSLGCSGGGNLTYLFAAADARIAASFVASTGIAAPAAQAPEGYFDRMFVDRAVTLSVPPGWPLSGNAMGKLVAPRPMWIMDGRHDLGIPAERRPAWWATMQAGRDSIRRSYERVGAGDRYRDTWFDAGHCGGTTVANALAWFGQWFGP